MKSRQHAQEEPAPEAGWAVSVSRAASEDVRELLRADQRRRRGRWFAGGLVVLAVGAVVTLLIRSSLFAPVTGDPVATVPAPVRSTAQFDLANPFDSTPAADWANGVAGITTPPAEAVGGFSAVQVAEATGLARDALAASRIDPRLLTEHDPAGYLGLLAPDARRQLEPLFAEGNEPDVQSLVSMVAPGSELLPAEPKVSGSMSVRTGDPDELVVHTNYVFAYAFRPNGPMKLMDAMTVIVVVRADVDYVLRSGDRWTQDSRGLWFGAASGFGYSIGCDAYRKGFLAPVAAEPSVTARSGDREPGAFFDPSAPLPAAGGCRG
ncbi:MAG: hypothetical protein WBA97_32650 [Actinophytocola sp.]|uniref:hypothetical protein n=1 Tax=Actinophytocola sp. TaxID=1872138 RepID=UPI003C72A85C